MKLRLTSLLLLLGWLFAGSFRAAAQSNYSFNLTKEVVQVTWNANGTESLDYVMDFTNDAGAATIDYVDMGMPNSHFDMSTVQAFVTADQISEFKVPVSTSNYQGGGSGFAVQMSLPIYASESGSIHVIVGSITNVLYKDTTDPTTYASAVFSPTWFNSNYVHGPNEMTVVFHLPPGLQPADPRYHTPSSNWPGPAAPIIGQDASGNITYTWQYPTASGSARVYLRRLLPQ